MKIESGTRQQVPDFFLFLKVSFRLRVLQPWLPACVTAAMGVRVVAYRRQERQIEGNACVLVAFCGAVGSGVPLEPFTHAGVFFRARTYSLSFMESD